jgi:hypothetical protein
MRLCIRPGRSAFGLTPRPGAPKSSDLYPDTRAMEASPGARQPSRAVWYPPTGSRSYRIWRTTRETCFIALPRGGRRAVAGTAPAGQIEGTRPGLRYSKGALRVGVSRGSRLERGSGVFLRLKQAGDHLALVGPDN